MFRMLFNTGVYVLAAFSSALPMFILGRPNAPGAALVTLWSFAGGAAFVTTNIFLVCLAVAFFQGTPLRPLLVDNLRHGGPAFLTMAFLAALAVVLWHADPVSLVLLAGPLVALTLYQRSSLASQIATRRRAHRQPHRARQPSRLRARACLSSRACDLGGHGACALPGRRRRVQGDQRRPRASVRATQRFRSSHGCSSSRTASAHSGSAATSSRSCSTWDATPAVAYAGELLQRIGSDRVPTRRARDDQRRRGRISRAGIRGGAGGERRQRPLLGEAAREEPPVRLRLVRRQTAFTGGGIPVGRSPGSAQGGGAHDPRGRHQGHLHRRALAVGCTCS